MTKLIIASQFILNSSSLAEYLIQCVKDEWIDANPEVYIPINFVKDGIADSIKSVVKQFKLESVEYHALWQDYSEPCQIRHNSFGKYNALAGQSRNLRMADDATHAIIVWDGNDRDIEVLINHLRFHNKPIKVILK